MNIEELGLAIRIAHKARTSLFVSGMQGLGKSACVKQYTESNFHFYEKDKNGKVLNAEVPYGYVDLRCASMESSELRGLPDKDKENNTVVYLPPDELPIGEWINNKGEVYGKPGDKKPEDTDDIKWVKHKGILVLEEINRSEDDIHQALFQLVYDYRIGKWEMPTGWSIVAAANPSGGNFIVNQFMHEAAFKDRFIHVTVEINEKYVEGWINYMFNLEGYNEQIISKITQYCSTDTDILSKPPSSDHDDIVIEPSPRSWEMVAKVETACLDMQDQYEKSLFDKVRDEMIAGIIGQDLVAGYRECVVEVTPKDIANNFEATKSVVDKLQRNQLQALSWGVAGYATKISEMKDDIADNLIAFGKWILKDASKKHGDNRDLAVGYFDSLLQAEQPEEIRELSFANKSMQKLLKKTNKSTYMWSKIHDDKELNELLYLSHRGQLRDN